MLLGILRRLYYKHKYRHATDTIPNFSLDGYRGWAKIVNVYDGDTFRAVVFKNNKVLKFTFRPLGYDAPEMKPRLDIPDRETHKMNAVIARDIFKELTGFNNSEPESNPGYCFTCTGKANGLVYLECYKNDKYGRTLVNVFAYPGSKSVNDLMLESGLVLPYDGKTKAEFVYSKSGKNK